MNNTGFFGYQKALKQDEIDYYKKKINTLTEECDDLSNVRTTLEGYVEELDSLIMNRAMEIFNCFENTLWVGNRVKIWSNDIDALGEGSIIKLREHISSNKDSLEQCILNKINEQLDYSCRINQLQKEVQYIDALLD